MTDKYENTISKNNNLWLEVVMLHVGAVFGGAGFNELHGLSSCGQLHFTTEAHTNTSTYNVCSSNGYEVSALLVGQYCTIARTGCTWLTN